MKKVESTYAGFLDGYIAGNLTVNSHELSYHCKKISSFIDNLKTETELWQLPDYGRVYESLFDNNHQIIDKVNKYPADLALYKELGNNLIEIVNLVTKLKEKLTVNSTYLIKKIIYHYLNIAETTKTEDIKSLAITMTEKFQTL